MLKLYAVLSQAQFVQHRASEWEAAFVGLLEVGVSRFLKHAAGVVIRKDKGFSNMVSRAVRRGSKSEGQCSCRLLLCNCMEMQC